MPLHTMDGLLTYPVSVILLPVILLASNRSAFKVLKTALQLCIVDVYTLPQVIVAEHTMLLKEPVCSHVMFGTSITLPLIVSILILLTEMVSACIEPATTSP